MSTSREVRFPLSPMQQGMLFELLSGAKPGVGIEQIVGTLHEDVDTQAFREAWARTAARHSVFRTTFSAWNGSGAPSQTVHPDVVLPIEVHDTRHLAPDARAAHLDEYLTTDRARAFDLTELPLMRVALFRDGSAEYRMVWTFPHLLLDGRSFPIVLEEVFAHAAALLRGEVLDRPAPRPYEEYIRWLQHRDAIGDEAFWRAYLKDVPGPVHLPSASTPSNGAGYGVREVCLSKATTSALDTFASAHGLTLNTLVQGAWAQLIARYTGESDILFGAARACRGWSAERTAEMVGMFMNVVPVRARIAPDDTLRPWLTQLRAQQRPVRNHEHAALASIQRWTGAPAGTALFESVLVFDYASLNASLRALGGAWQHREFRLAERTGYPLTLNADGGEQLVVRLTYDRSRFDPSFAGQLVGHMTTLLEAMPAHSERPVRAQPLLTGVERHRLLVSWNDTRQGVANITGIHRLFEEQVRRSPDAAALIAEDAVLTYRQLNGRANRLARRLRELGAAPGMRIGLCVSRSSQLLVALLGTLKSGAAYVPLDPEYPKQRLEFMLADAGVTVLVTERHLSPRLPECTAARVFLDPSPEAAADPNGDEDLSDGATADDLCYVIYTSGSTGTPKGVMVRHRNVVNLFAGMDERIGSTPTGRWLAVTSLSFDISVLELLWPLVRGWTVVLYAGEQHRAPSIAAAARPIEFSLFYFASDESAVGRDKYRLLVDGARFADQHGFAAVWTPERHFHAFGGLYPNPSVTGAAVAAVTERVAIRAGSVVLPLHHPLRVAEEWSVVDNLSGGRVGISFASGWHPNDFVLRPESYAESKQIMLRDIDVVRRLWRGEALQLKGPKGNTVEVRTLPRPVQPELPFWLTAAGSPETFRLAGELGAGLLTHLLGQDLDELAKKLEIYRAAWKQHGHAGPGHVTLMLHTFLAADDATARETVRGPLREYLRSSVNLIKPYAAAFPPLQRRRGSDAGAAIELESLSAEEMEELLSYSFERYYRGSGLFGSPSSCVEMIDRLQTIGIDEVACLIDFGVEPAAVMESLQHLATLREACATRAPARTRSAPIPALILQQGATHLQCTPSLAGMLLEDERAREALGRLHVLLVGGEALSSGLAAKLQAVVSGDILNMYGPTETTVWSATYRLRPGDTTIPIGRPIANTQCYVVDELLQPVPVGVAGELLIGGDGVAAGYLHQPTLTAERFVQDPWSTDSSARLYRTGDRVRYRPDGNLEFLGRADHQVKLRGVRVELGEIEAVLSRYPNVREAAAAVRRGANGEQWLVAYVVPTGGTPPRDTELRDYLQDKLPEVMVPSLYVPLDSLPRTANGKLDRRALPAPSDVQPRTESAFIGPRNSLERQLALLWEDVLAQRPIGVRDNFFDLGGHSLLAVALVSRIRECYGRRVPPDLLFQAQTVEQLALALREEFWPGASSPLVALREGGHRAPLFLVHGYSGHVFGYQALARRLGSEQPVYGLQAPGLTGDEAPVTRVEDLASQYITAIRSIQPGGPYHLSGAQFGGVVAFEMARQLRAQGEEIGLLVLLHSTAPGPVRNGVTLAGATRRVMHQVRSVLELPLRASAARRNGWTLRPVGTVPSGSESAASVRHANGATVLTVAEATRLAERSYEPQRVPVPVAVFRASNWRAARNAVPHLGWEAWSDAVDVYDVPGDDTTMLEEPYVGAVADRLRQCLEAAASIRA
ncbi:MAG TPA: MupA/Atu3671 family FMN-dependent luciferase-like monooxygenase [Gemmatimonadales bacterium]|nr:MupA/Atu3671 family FMN-dependent luciferase-like monooxygenase [Gemmatimonadales bacterium]